MMTGTAMAANAGQETMTLQRDPRRKQLEELGELNDLGERLGG